MRGMKHGPWLMMGLVALTVGCQPEAEFSAPSTGSPQASRTGALTAGSWSSTLPWALGAWGTPRPCSIRGGCW